MLIESSSDVMFLIIGGRGYHEIRVRTILHSWARCVRHVLVFTDPSVNLSGYASEGRFVYVSAGDAWLRCVASTAVSATDTHGGARPADQSARFTGGKCCLVLFSDRSHLCGSARSAERRAYPRPRRGPGTMRVVLNSSSTLDPNLKGYGYYGQTANSTHKEAFGFHAYVDLSTGVLLSTTLLGKIADPAQCHDQKKGDSTFDMFDAKLGNCI